MDLLTLLKILWRRWMVVIPVLIITAVSGVVIVGKPEVRYSGRGSDLLVTRSQTAEGADGAPTMTPLLATGLVVNALRRPDFEQSIVEAGFKSSFAVAIGGDGALIDVSVMGTDPSDVLETALEIIDRAPVALEDEVGSEAAAAIRLTPLAVPTIDDVIELDSSWTLTTSLAALPATQVNNPFPPGASTIRTLTEVSQRRDVVVAVLTEVPSASFRVGGESRPVAPIVEIEVSADQPADVVRAYEVLRAQVAAQLQALQEVAGVNEQAQTVMISLVPLSSVSETSGSVVRPAAGVALIGLAAACGAAILVDVLLQRRRGVTSSAAPARDDA